MKIDAMLIVEILCWSWSCSRDSGLEKSVECSEKRKTVWKRRDPPPEVRKYREKKQTMQDKQTSNKEGGKLLEKMKLLKNPKIS